MSLVTFVLGSALNSPQFQTLMGLGPILTVNFQSDVSNARRRSRCQNGKILNEVLTRRNIGSSGRRLNRGR